MTMGLGHASRLAGAAAAVMLCAACQFQPGSLGERRDGGSVVEDGTMDSLMPLDANDAAVDAAPDAAIITRTCPLTYTITAIADPESKYRLVTASDDWLAAETDCENDGDTVALLPTHLVVLDSAAESDWVFDEATTDKWVGVSDRNTEGTLQAVTDQPTPHFGNAEAQDNQKDCMFVNQNETLMESCNATFQYLCECDAFAADPANY